MTDPRKRSVLSDLEKPHPTVVDRFDDASGAEEDIPPMVLRIGDLWSDLIRVADGAPDPESPGKSPSHAPILDGMRGILEWD